MLIRCLKSKGLVIMIVCLTSCRPVIKTINNTQIPREVRTHFAVLEVRDGKLVDPIAYNVKTDDYLYVYTLYANLTEGRIKGRIQEQIIPTNLAGLPTEENSERKNFLVNIPTRLCCSNHTPQDCVKNEKIAADSSAKKGCTNWKVVLL